MTAALTLALLVAFAACVLAVAAVPLALLMHLTDPAARESRVLARVLTFAVYAFAAAKLLGLILAA